MVIIQRPLKPKPFMYTFKSELDTNLLAANRQPVKNQDGTIQTVFGFIASLLFLSTTKDKLRIRKFGTWAEALTEKENPKPLELSSEDFKLVMETVESNESSYDGHKYQAFKILDKIKEEAEKPRSGE
jgi:hypothetical protein